MAFLSRASGKMSIAIVLVLTMLVTWISGSEEGDHWFVCSRVSYASREVLTQKLFTNGLITSKIGSLNKQRDEVIIDVGSPDDVFFEIVYPPELEYTYRVRPAQDFGAPFNASFSERRIALVPVEPATGCRTPDNAERLYGKVALVWRGDCSFYKKAAIAEDAGAKAIIVADYGTTSIDDEREMPYWMDYLYVEMASDNEISLTRNVNIPAGFLHGKNGRIIKETLMRLDLQYALINIPVNLTFASLQDFHQPPWVAL